MYNVFFQLYVWVFRLIALFHPKAGKMVRGGHRTWRRLEQAIPQDAKTIWFHASSSGEFEQGRPLLEAIRRRYPEYKIIQTFYSPSGFEARKDYPGADVVCYLPFDTKLHVRRFLRLAHPSAMFLIKYDFWPNYLQGLRQSGVPVYLVSGIFRPTQMFFRWPGSFFRKMLFCIEHFFVQNEQSAQLLDKIGLGERVTVCGDTRSDRVLEIAAEAKQLFMLESFAETPSTLMEASASEDAEKTSARPQMLIAGSSWPKDEALFIPYFNEHPNLKLIVAPHLINESHLQYIEGLLKRPYVRYSQLTIEKVAHADCIIIDCFGLLSSIYRYGQVAYIGGGFGAGIHNTLEAAVYGIPVVFGPRYQKFDEAKALLACGGAQSVTNEYGELPEAMDRWFEHPEDLQKAGQAAKDYVQRSSGGTQVILHYLSEKL